MCKRLVWLWIAVILATSALATAQPPALKEPPKVPAPPNRQALNPAQQIQADVAAGKRPTSESPLLAPNDMPNNTVKILRTTNKAQTNSYVPVVFDFTHNNPFNVIRFLHRPVQTEEGDLFTFVNPDNNGGKVLFVVPDYMVDSLRELVATIDRPGMTTGEGTKRVYQQLRHRRADPTDPDFLATVASFETGDGSKLIADPEENALYLEDAPSGIDTAVQALKDWLDVPTAMVELVVKVYEIDATNDATVGLDYIAWKNGPGASLFATQGFAEHGSFPRAENVKFDPIGTGARGLPHDNFTASGWNYAYRYEVSSAFFDYLAVKGKARVMNSMKLAALNTRPATLTAGDQVLFYAVNANTSTTESAGVRNINKPFQSNTGRTVTQTVNQLNGAKLTPVQTGLTLNVTPTIGEQSVRMGLDLSWTDYNFIDDAGLPQINPRALNTTINVTLGDEIIIGGLDRQVAVSGTQKVPFLGSIPILGYAFGKETTQSKKTEMIVVVRPTAIFNYDVAKDYRILDSEQQIIDQATGVQPVAEPKTTFGFEMPGLDPEMGAPAEGLK